MLAEVGDDQVHARSSTAEPDRAHGPGDSSSSMMAGPVTDSIGHSDDHGERVTVSHGASKAEQVEARAARKRAAGIRARDRQAWRGARPQG